MRAILRQTLFSTLLLLVWASISPHAWADHGRSPAYARRSLHASAGRYGHFPVLPVAPGGWGLYGGFYQAPQVSGSWYQRPYPYHFDYYRWRSSTPPAQPECSCQEVNPYEENSHLVVPQGAMLSH